MPIATRLTERLDIVHPVVSAPMDVIAGGRLAAAVSGAGGLGFLGGGYADDAGWFEREFAAAGNQAVGCGSITSSLRNRPELLDVAIARSRKAIFLSFDDPEPFASHIKAAGIPCSASFRPVPMQSARSIAAPTSSWRKAPKEAVTAAHARP